MITTIPVVATGRRIGHVVWTLGTWDVHLIDGELCRFIGTFPTCSMAVAHLVREARAEEITAWQRRLSDGRRPR